jgi:hypothetical protein
MSAKAVKLSPAIKALISAPHARGSALPSPSPQRLNSLFDTIRSRARPISTPTFLTLSTAALVTVNSPQSLCDLYSYVEKDGDAGKNVEAAAAMRETALKCISFSGIPRVSRVHTVREGELTRVDDQRTDGSSRTSPSSGD